MGGWRDFIFFFSALWVLSAIQTTTHPKPVQIKFQPSHQLILKADVPSHPAPSAEHSAPPVFFLPSEIATQLATEGSYTQLYSARVLAPEKNYQLIRTGLSPPSETVFI